ncbi:DUF4209 domain-containing protein [Sulfurospirillum multivorans]|uniref:DUF4209 domain-containing protein n=2 Tax=Sulfurospirillum multivorans TaxID=66821 RepID=A0AA86AJP3_SULMK|nr:DUF4209 domain-containing protein [Sulfurospirillum multivorans]AHJ11791.1 hypothetical protein SMUL_0516 [Sulfurospirillum multivorans DSM 12446]QEH05297.1 hypothetical protein SMN_0514 [Sulfurospirillum multivorans]
MTREECGNAPLLLQNFISIRNQIKCQKDCNEFSFNFHQLAQDADESTIARIYFLMSDLCSMMLHPQSKNEPFSPHIILADGRRSAILDDFTSEELDFFELILPECKTYQIKARIADVLWTLKRGKVIDFAKIAIENYQKYPLSHDTIHYAGKAWQRAILLALTINQPTENLTNHILEHIKITSNEDNFYLMRLVEILDIAKLAKEEIEVITTQLEIIAQQYKEQRFYYQSTQYYQYALKWARKLKNQELCHKLLYETGFSFYQNALAQPYEFQSTAHYENALQTLRQIPQKHRDTNNIHALIAEIEKKIPESNQITLEYMQRVKTQIDTKEMVEYSEKAVSNQPKFKTLFIFANLIDIPTKEYFKEQAQAHIQQFPLQHLSGGVHINHDGRTIAKTPSIDLKESTTADFDTLFPTMVQNYKNYIELTAQAYVIPALFQLLLEHRITKEDLYLICTNSTLVPNERVVAWVEGLWHGFELNFLVSIQLLVPQVEHFVRLELKGRGVKTTTIDKEGIETELGLSKLLEKEEIHLVLSENLLFEMQVLLAKPLGYNFRNNLAHGLSEVGEMNSYPAAYVWWLCLKLVINNNSFDFK